MNRYRYLNGHKTPINKKLLMELEEFKQHLNYHKKKNYGGNGWERNEWAQFPLVMAILNREFKRVKPTLIDHHDFTLVCYPEAGLDGITLGMASLGGTNISIPQNYYDPVFIPYVVFDYEQI